MQPNLTDEVQLMTQSKLQVVRGKTRAPLPGTSNVLGRLSWGQGRTGGCWGMQVPGAWLWAPLQ